MFRVLFGMYIRGSVGLYQGSFRDPYGFYKGLGLGVLSVALLYPSSLRDLEGFYQRSGSSVLSAFP